MICKKGIVLILFSRSRYAEAILANIQNICFFKVLNAIFLHDLWRIVTA